MIKPKPATAIVLTFTFWAVFLFPNCALKLKLKPMGAASYSDEQTIQKDNLEYWDFIQEIVASPLKTGPPHKQEFSFLDNGFPTGGFGYVYGGKTAYKFQKGTNKKYNRILACYLDNADYSGVTVSLGINNSINLELQRKKRAAGIGFWAKAGPGLNKVYFGILDDDSDDKKVQSKLSIGDYGKIDTTWRFFLIPLKRFSARGKYWDPRKKMEILDSIDWKSINEFRFSTNSGENRAVPGHPLRLYIASMSVIDDIPGYVDPAEYWAGFQSDEQDYLLHDFEALSDRNWETSAGPGSTVSIDFPDPEDPAYGKSSLSISYKLYQWCDVMYDYVQNNAAGKKRDWTRHWGLTMDIHVKQAYQPFSIQISDAGNELFFASAGAPHGWSRIIVPFRDFDKFPYYQPPEAEQNGNFDLDGVVKIDIKPGGEGNSGTFLVDNVKLTNNRTLEKETTPSRKPVVISGSMDSILVERINPGIFGINAQAWDSDLLHPETSKFVKAVGHGTVRFPGGLSADEYHWKKELKSKNGLVDVDEFLKFCKKTDNKPVFTVNFGTGTVEEAAGWVRYVKEQKKAKARYWEVGNELYGGWHKNHCTAEEYGKRSVGFLKAMKAADPALLAGVVWELSGDWNKTVFHHTKDLADAVIIHNYPQLTGEENDINLLASPQRLDGIIAGVREDLAKYGSPKKKYQIWLTEWNSVNFNPGPQSLSIVNGLFVADYLGMLAKSRIELAHYWNIHNGMFEQGGDYGYLSRSDVPEGANLPRPAYPAFKLARNCLRGKLFLAHSDDINLTVYGSRQSEHGKTLLIINKYPRTTCVLTMKLNGFYGKGKLVQLTAVNFSSGLKENVISLKKGGQIEVPPYSISMLRLLRFSE